MNDILYFGMDDWYAVHKRPRHLATNLAATHRVFYVNPCYYSAPGFVRDTVRGRRLRKMVWGVEEVSPSLFVLSFPPLFPKGALYPVFGRLNYYLLLPFIRHTLRQFNVDKFILWLSTPSDQFLTGKLNEELAVYDCMDRHGYFYEGYVRQLVEKEERAMLGRVDVVTVSSAQLQEYCCQYHTDVHIVRNGVELADFHEGRESADPLPEITGSVIGYIGYVAPWIDLDLLASICHSFPNATLVLVGPVIVDVSALKRFPNAKILGERPYQEMAGYISQFDVCLIPFRINELTRAVNPIKLYEYFAMGKSVVTTALPELESYHDVVHVAHSELEFIEGVAAALSEAQNPIPERVQYRQRIAQENSWQRRAAQVDQILAARLPAHPDDESVIVK